MSRPDSILEQDRPAIADKPRYTSSAVAPAPVHLGFLDALRGLASLWVIANHGFRMPWPRFGEAALVEPDGWFLWLTGWSRFGHFAVTLFIVLSGFCLMLPVSRRSGTLTGGAWLFFKRRAWRILPTYFAALALSLLLIATILGEPNGSQWDGAIPVTTRGVLARVFMLQDLIDARQINPPFWSVAVEWRIYFLFPLLVLGFARIGAFAVTALMLLLFEGLTLATFGTPLAWTPIYYAGIFTLGMLASDVCFSPAPRMRWLRERPPWGVLSLGLCGLVIAACLYKNSLPWIEFRQQYFDYAIALASFAGLIAVARRPRGIADRLLSARPLVFLGSYSYSIYLMHFPLQAVVWQYLIVPLGLEDRRLSLLLLWGPGTLLVLAGTYLFFLAFERPVLKRRPVAALRPAPAVAFEPGG